MGTVITGAALAAVVFAIIRSMVKAKKNGTSVSCGCGCEHCSKRCGK